MDVSAWDATAWATFWVFLALIVFIGILVYVKVPGMLGAALDKRAEKIRSDLEDARRLRDEGSPEPRGGAPGESAPAI